MEFGIYILGWAVVCCLAGIVIALNDLAAAVRELKGYKDGDNKEQGSH